MNAGDTAFILLCAAFVFIMTPGLAFFYGGMVRRKNVGNTMMQCVFIMGVSVIMWVLVGYALSFGGNHAGIIGGAKWFGFNGVGMKPGPYADTIPNLAFAAFQMMFAMITPALITGSVAGRMKFKALVLFYYLMVIDRVLPNGTYGMGRRRILSRDRVCRFRRRKCCSYHIRGQRSGISFNTWKTSWI